LYFFGGASRWSGTVRYPRIYKFDGSTWSYHDSIPDDNVWDVQSVRAGDDVYLLGGWPSGARLLRKYNLPSKSYSYLSQSPNVTSYGTTAEYLNGTIYLFNDRGNVFSYDISDSTWDSKTANDTAGYLGLSSIVYQDEIYLVGYYGNRFYKYTPATDMWQRLADVPDQIADCAMGIINNQIYCAGGSTQGAPAGMRQSVLVYNISTNSWSTETFQISSPRIKMAEVMFQGRLFVLGGFDSSSFAVDIVEEIISVGPVGIERANVAAPFGHYLSQNYPNPFNNSTNISFGISKHGTVELIIYDIAGQLIRTLVKNELRSGNHLYQWDGKDDDGRLVASGMYFYQIVFDNSVQTRKMLLVQ
jgi:N-acetylneuraminic acid mutarotase